MQDFIQLKKTNILKIGIKDAEGNDTGEHLEFDLEDIELPIKVNQSAVEHKNNMNYLKSQYTIIEKRQDKETNGIFTANEKEKLNTLKEFYRREIKALDLFLGEGGTKKILNGRIHIFQCLKIFLTC